MNVEMAGNDLLMISFARNKM